MNNHYSLSSPHPTFKRQTLRRMTAEDHHRQPLIPGLPDDISHLCLSLVPPSSLYSVCRSWRRLLYSPSFPPFLSLYAILLSPDNINNNNITGRSKLFSSPVHFASFDPISSKWQPVPNPPPGAPLRLLLRHPLFISHRIPVQSVAVSGNLVLIAATADHFLPALSQPLVFDPISGDWSVGPPIAAPRRWCAAGAYGGSVYVASGIGSQYHNGVARTLERWDLDPTRTRWSWRWEEMAKLGDAKFSREAIDAVGWRGKLCMVNVKGAAAEGIVYDVGRDAWEAMPAGMLAGWRGPAAAMAEETLYVVDERRGWLKEYDHVRDTWEEVVRDEMLEGAQQVVAAEGKVCVLCADGDVLAVVDVAAPPPERVRLVEVPPGFQAVGIHVLPRMCSFDV